MKKTIRSCLALALAAMLALGCCATAFAADGDTEDDAPKASTIQMEVTFGQSKAREMLDLINDFRTGDDAWYWKNNQTQEIFYPVLDELTYDYTLEKAAMQRAAEIALYFSYNHIRPSGANCVSVITDMGLNGRWLNYGENIAIASTGEQAFNLWLEEDQPYSGQGHRRNMLGGFNAVGIGHVYYNGVHYWVQEFAMLFPNYINTTPTQAVDGQQTVDVVVRNDKISDVLLTPEPDSLTLELGQTAALPEIGVDLRLDLAPKKSNPVTANVQWDAASDRIVELSNDGTITAKAVGTTDLTATVLGKSVTIPVVVNAASLANADITLNQDSWSYTGKPITPTATVTLNGILLVEGTDYTLAYQNNTEEGTGTVTITGIGSYRGTATKNFTITACQHVWDEGKVTQAATCTQEGLKTYTCASCGKTRTESIPATGHTEVAYPAAEATCTAEGHAAGTQCSVCGTILSGGEVTPALGHRYDEGKITKQPTCEEEGVKTYTCTGCGDSYTEAISATGHSWDEGKVTKDPTCEEEGVKTYTCTDCGATYTEAVAALGHSYDKGEITKEPTCTVEGVKTYTCTACGDSYTEAIPATGHSFGPWETVASPSCTDEGSEQRICTVCKYVETGNLDATGHAWETDYTVDWAATCTTDGSQSIHCANCSAIKDAQVIPATGHAWDQGTVTQAATCTEPGVMTYHCTVCGETQTGAIPATGHSWDEGKVTQAATCTEAGVKTYTCTACNGTYTEAISALGHDYDEGEITKEPTCTVDGEITYTCERCGATLKDPVDAQGHSWDQGRVSTEPTCDTVGIRVYTCQSCGETKSEIIPANGHTFGDEWLSNEEGHWKLCEVCQEYETQTEAHTLVWLTDQAPTATEPGSCHEECTVCGYQGETKALPATGATGGDDAGDTGDAGTGVNPDNTGDTGAGVNVGNAGDTGHTDSEEGAGVTDSDAGTGNAGQVGNGDSEDETHGAAQDQSSGPAETDSGKTAPQTGDESKALLCAVILALSMGTLASVTLWGRRRKG